MVPVTVERRAFLETITWRFVATATTIIVAFIFTGSLVISLEIGSVEMILKLFFYYLHERSWDRVELTTDTEDMIIA